MMKHWTVKRRVIVGFSAVMVIMIVLSLFSYERLAAIETLTTELRRDSVPSLHLAGKLHGVTIQGHASVRQHVAEADAERMQQSLTSFQQQSIERVDLARQHDALALTPSERAAVEATRAAMAPYIVMTTELLRLSADPRTKLQAVALLRDQLEPLYAELLGAIEAEVEVSSAGAICRQRAHRSDRDQYPTSDSRQPRDRLAPRRLERIRAHSRHQPLDHQTDARRRRDPRGQPAATEHRQ